MILLWSSLVVIFPLWQIIQSSYVFYTNSLDEASYLQYDYALFVNLVAGGARGIQWIIPRLHSIGIAGGYINLLFDLICFPLTCYLACKRIGYWRGICSIGLISLFTTANPLIEDLSSFIQSNDLIKWVAMPFSSDQILLRTPEPQFTFLLASIHPYLALPFAYPFVGLPALCACIAYPLRKRTSAILIGIIFTLACATCARYFLLSPQVSNYGAFSHAPLFSVSAMFALIFFSYIRKQIGTDEKFMLQALIIGLVVSQNQQLLSGFLLQPSNLEQYFGVPLCSYLFVRLLEVHLPKRQDLIWNLSICSMVISLVSINIFNYKLLSSATLDKALISSAISSPRETVDYNVRVATTLNLIAPKQAPTLLSITAAYGALADRYVGEYRFAKAKLMQIQDVQLTATLTLLDSVYRFENRDALLNNIKRREDFGAARDVTATAAMVAEVSNTQ